MHRPVARYILVLSLLTPAALFAQSNRLDGLWVVGVPKGVGTDGIPGFLAFTFHGTGDTFTGSVSDTGGPARRFNNGKIENESLSFSLPKEESAGVMVETFYTGTLKDDRHLDLVSVFHNSFTVDRLPGAAPPPNPLTGEWEDKRWKHMRTFVFRVQGDTLTGEVIDRSLLALHGKKITGGELHLPLTDGAAHGNESSFRFITSTNSQMYCTGALVGDHLTINSENTSKLRAVRVADAASASGAATAPNAGEAPAGKTGGNMALYRDQARLVMEAVKKNDMTMASALCQKLERAWDQNEQALQRSSPDVWGQIDRAMDDFIHLITRSGGAMPNASALDTAYRNYLDKLKLVS